MRKNDLDLSKPRRQSYAAILIITYRLYRVIVKQLFIPILYFLFKSTQGKSYDYLPSLGITFM